MSQDRYEDGYAHAIVDTCEVIEDLIAEVTRFNPEAVEAGPLRYLLKNELWSGVVDHA